MLMHINEIGYAIPRDKVCTFFHLDIPHIISVIMQLHTRHNVVFRRSDYHDVIPMWTGSDQKLDEVCSNTTTSCVIEI